MPTRLNLHKEKEERKKWGKTMKRKKYFIKKCKNIAAIFTGEGGGDYQTYTNLRYLQPEKNKV